MQLLNVSHIQQRKQADCLAACAAMSLTYIGASIRYPRLLRLLDVQEVGAVFRRILNLRSRGFAVTYEEGDMHQLRLLIDAGIPVIVPVLTDQLAHWAGERTYHAILVVGYENHEIIIHDPAFSRGNLAVSADEFELAWLERDYLYATIER